jgi:hypothetical protein
MAFKRSWVQFHPAPSRVLKAWKIFLLSLFRADALLFFELNQVDKDFVWGAALLAEALGAP